MEHPTLRSFARAELQDCLRAILAAADRQAGSLSNIPARYKAQGLRLAGRMIECRLKRLRDA